MPEFATRTRGDQPQLFVTVLAPEFPRSHDNVLIMLSRFFALLIWGAVAFSAAFWGLRWFGKALTVPPGTSPATMDGGLRGDLGKLLSGPVVAASGPAQADPSQQAALSGRLQVLGVVAPKHEGDTTGVALLVLDGKPARAYKLGQVVDGDLVIQSITQRSVQIGPSGQPAAVTLDLPLMPAAATGMLPAATGVTMGAAAAPMSPPRAMASANTYNVPPPQAGMGMNNSSVEGGEPVAGNAPPRDSASAPRTLPPRIRRRSGVPAINGMPTPDPQQAM